MKIKIEIKHWITGSVLFVFEKEDNTVKSTLIEAVSKRADLRGAYLRGADLQGAYLRGADLQGADLQGAYLQGADLQGADLQGAYLRGAYLRGAYLQGAGVSKIEIKTCAVYTGLYEYTVIPYITSNDEKRIKMGCYDRSLTEWQENFWNNDNEFPNDGSLKSKSRVLAFNTAKAWFELIESSKP